MENINLLKILNRENKAKQIKDFLLHFEEYKHDITIKRGLYISGHPGSGKTYFVASILKDLGYDGVFYDAGDIRNKVILEEMSKLHMADRSVISLMEKKAR